MKNKIIDNEKFVDFLKLTITPDIFYFNMDTLQKTYKDIAGVTLIMSSVQGTTYGAKFGSSLLRVITLEVGGDKTKESEQIYSPKDLLLKIFNDKKYSHHFKVLKVRMSEVYKTSNKTIQSIDFLNGNIREENVEKFEYNNALRILNKDTPRSVKERSISKDNYFEDTYVFLEEEYTNGILKDFLFNKASYWHTTKPDIDADDFYLVCIDTFSFDRVRDLTDGYPYYDLICPLAVLRIKEIDISK